MDSKSAFMKILLTGKNGQLGSKLENDLKNLHEVIATDRETMNLIYFQAIKDKVSQIKPNLIINTAAYTDVDKAEKEKNLAYKVNVLAPKFLSEVAKELDIPIIHISTDYVFDGTKKTPYLEDDQANPLSIYGLTKWQGEEFVRRVPKHFILRTSWIFSSQEYGFVRSIYELAQKKISLSVVQDQWGSPTSVKTLSKAIQTVIENLPQQDNADIYGTYHVTSEGLTNWYSCALEILEGLELQGVKLKLRKEYLHPVTSSQYPQNALRPRYSKLNTAKFKKTFKLDFPSWKEEISFN